MKETQPTISSLFEGSNWVKKVEHDRQRALGKPFRVVAQLRNNRLINAREHAGYPSMRAAALAAGVTPAIWGEYEGLKRSPWRTDGGGWRRSAAVIASFLGYVPEDLWPEVIAQVTATKAVFEASPSAVTLLSDADPGMLLERRELSEATRVVLAALTPREQLVLRHRFGFEGEDPKTLEQIGDLLGYSKERMRQIEAKALRKIRRSEGAGTIVPVHKRLLSPWKDER